MNRTLRMLLSAGLLLGGLHRMPLLHAQEPAVISGDAAVRFEHSPGFFHYAALCRTATEFMAQMPPGKLPRDLTEPAVCWYVKVSKVPAGTGMNNTEPEADGKLVISAHHVRFIPHNPQFSMFYADLHPEQTVLNHESGRAYARLRSNSLVLSFRFSKLCPACASGTPIGPGFNSALLDREFGLLNDSLSHFETGWNRIYYLSSVPQVVGPQVELADRNQRAGSVGSTGSHPGTESESGSVSKPAASVSNPSASSSPGPSASTAPGTASATAGKVPLPPWGQTHDEGLKVLEIAPETAAGMLVKGVEPVYPVEAKRTHLEGTVVLRLIIDEAGEVSAVGAISGPPVLEFAAVAAVRQWQYRPYSVDGRPVQVATTIKVAFALDKSQSSNRTEGHTEVASH